MTVHQDTPAPPPSVDAAALHQPPPDAPPVTPSVDITALYRAHASALYGFIYDKVGNRAAAEDITGDVFVKALTHVDPARAEHSSVAWLYRVARNAVHDYWRSGQGVPPIALEDAGPLPQPHSAPETARQGHMAAAARARAILARLPDTYRAVLSLRLLEGLSVAETAQRMGISAGNVKVLQHRALEAAARHERS